MKFLKEFKEFAMRGNVIDLAVGVVIGGAFSAIVSALVANIIMPLIGLITGGIDVSSLSVTLGTGENAAVLQYGVFINAVVDFLLIALVLFLLVKGMNRLKKKKVEQPAAPVYICEYCREQVAAEATRCPHCGSEIKPSLKK